MEFEKIIPASDLAVAQCGNELPVNGSVLAVFAEQAFKRLYFTFPQEHLESLLNVACDPASSENDRLVAVKLLENAVIAAKGTLPLCQDTGVAQVFAWKASSVYSVLNAVNRTMPFTSDTEALTAGVGKAYKENNLRFSINIPSSLFDEKNSATNLPAQVDVFSTNGSGEPSYRFLFCAKGGGSSNGAVKPAIL